MTAEQQPVVTESRTQMRQTFGALGTALKATAGGAMVAGGLYMAAGASVENCNAEMTPTHGIVRGLTRAQLAEHDANEAYLRSMATMNTASAPKIVELTGAYFLQVASQAKN